MNRIVYTAKGKDIARSYRGKRPRTVYWFAGLILVFAAALSLYIFWSSDWRVAGIQISGTETLDENEVRLFISEEISGKYAFVFPKDLIFLVDARALEGKLKEKFPVIAAVSTKKVYPAELRLEIREREIWGILCSSSACAFIDKTGFAYERAPESAGSLIVKFRGDFDFEVPSQVIAPATSEKLADLAEKLRRVLGAEVVEYTLFSKIPDEARLKLDEGFEVYLDLNGDPEASLKVLETVLRDEIKDKRGRLEYIDLRFGNKVFYKSRPQAK